jgi:ribosomal-protein-alanine N-acetyltransferase
MVDAGERPGEDKEMAFFRVVNFAEQIPAIEGEGVFLRAPTMGDYEEWAVLREDSRVFLTPWEPTWPADDLTRGAYRRRLRRYAEDQRADQAYPFFIFRKSDQALVGGLTLANVRRGVAQAGTLGYWMGAPFARHGYMGAAVRSFLPHAFSLLRLHRIEAACIPTNVPSVRLLQKNGFNHEGYAREYLCINGVWQDHLLFARLRDGALSPSTRAKASPLTQPKTQPMTSSVSMPFLRPHDPENSGSQP